MRVLVACEYSGTVRDAFLRCGDDAMSCDILQTESPGPHYKGSVLDVLGDGWDLMIAHPPCTYLTNCANRVWEEQGRARKRLDGLRFFLDLWEAPIPKICIENPLGCADRVIAKHTQIIHPYYFGDREFKKTCLWLKGLPPLQHTKEETLFEKKSHTPKPEPKYICQGPKSKGKAIHWSEGMKAKDRGHARSKFWPSIAEAMAEQWGTPALTKESSGVEAFKRETPYIH